MKERNKEILDYELRIQALLYAPNPTTASIMDRARDFVWLCFGGRANETEIEEATKRVIRALTSQIWTWDEVVQILDAAHREGAATIKQRFLANLPLTYRNQEYE